MSDAFKCLPFEKLLTWIKQEEKTGKIFGIPESLFFRPSKTDGFKMNRYGRVLETPLGVAAGPHTQLSQNIISAWLTGARYIELKTVQVLDELDVTKPCISMADEGYNCEWSQELKLNQSFDEYLNALVAIHILKKRLQGNGNGWETAEPGFLFNMSVGYNLEGILSPTVQNFLDAMADSKDKIAQKLAIAQSIFPEAADLNIPSAVSDNITISTMHGCPPDEIEKIGLYFIKERKLNTTIKLNPTLLGATDLRQILNSDLGFDVTVPDLAFEHDLKYDDGIKLIQNLLGDAKASGVEFNLKLTNTLETTNNKNLLPGNEPMVYMSGRPLHAISMNLAAKLQKEFNGDLDISFSAGADCFNLADILACGLKPVTICSDILKPGGYGRLSQYLTMTRQALEMKGAKDISQFILASTTDSGDEKGKNEKKAALENLTAYADTVKHLEHYNKKSFPFDDIKTARSLTAFDCISAPCKGTCPAGQDVPAYMYHTAKGDFEKALQAIHHTNPFPNVQGLVCDHPCTQKCTRINYDQPLKIREIKRFVAQNSPVIPKAVPLKDNGLKAAVIGGGPSGFSAAYFLRMNGFSVELFESKPFGGGMAANAIPSFRLDDLSINTDIERIVNLGVKVNYDTWVDKAAFEDIRNRFDYVYIGVGAIKAYPLNIPGADAFGVYDQLEFLSAVRRGSAPDIGKNVVVVGGGNSAMDAVRAAKRLVKKSGTVSILYRRTIKQMPADLEEIEAVQAEGIQILELVNPDRIIVKEGVLSGIECHKMELGEADDSGRPRPVAIDGSEFTLPVDTVISAIGQQVMIPFLDEDDFKVDSKTFEIGLDKVYAGGDAIRGASTLIRAIGDGQNAVKQIVMDAAIENHSFKNNQAWAYEPDIVQLEIENAKRQYQNEIGSTPTVNKPESDTTGSEPMGFQLETQPMSKEDAMAEAARCLSCDTICNICATVCPNRANVSYSAPAFKAPAYKVVIKNGESVIEDNGFFLVAQANQIVNVGDFCNECGNCTTFCPTSGSPYKDKPKFYLSESEFKKETDGYYLKGNCIIKKKQGKTLSLTRESNTYLFAMDQLKATLDVNSFKVNKIDFSQSVDMDKAQITDLTDAVELVYFYNALKDRF